MTAKGIIRATTIVRIAFFIYILCLELRPPTHRSARGGIAKIMLFRSLA